MFRGLLQPIGLEGLQPSMLRPPRKRPCRSRSWQRFDHNTPLQKRMPPLQPWCINVFIYVYIFFIWQNIYTYLSYIRNYFFCIYIYMNVLWLYIVSFGEGFLSKVSASCLAAESWFLQILSHAFIFCAGDKQRKEPTEENWAVSTSIRFKGLADWRPVESWERHPIGACHFFCEEMIRSRVRALTWNDCDLSLLGWNCKIVSLLFLGLLHTKGIFSSQSGFNIEHVTLLRPKEDSHMIH